MKTTRDREREEIRRILEQDRLAVLQLQETHKREVWGLKRTIHQLEVAKSKLETELNRVRRAERESRQQYDELEASIVDNRVSRNVQADKFISDCETHVEQYQTIIEQQERDIEELHRENGRLTRSYSFRPEVDEPRPSPPLPSPTPTRTPHQEPRTPRKDPFGLSVFDSAADISPHPTLTRPMMTFRRPSDRIPSVLEESARASHQQRREGPLKVFPPRTRPDDQTEPMSPSLLASPTPSPAPVMDWRATVGPAVSFRITPQKGSASILMRGHR